MKNWKRGILLLLILVLCVSLSACSSTTEDSAPDNDSKIAAGNDTVPGKKEKFTFWLYKTVDASYYTDYNDNPVVKFLTNQTWGDTNTQISFDFWVPPAGSAVDNFSNMIGSGDYADIIQNTIGETPLNSYQNGISLDLTEYVKQYMPNYMAYLDANPDMKDKAVVNLDGEERYLSIISMYDAQPAPLWGHMYRRDWIVKYGTNPETGAAFTGGYATQGDVDSWQDDVVFPSGNSNPIYLSDWEWMFEIFDAAYADLNLSDSYCYTVPYNGYLAIGELSSSFGGVCSGTWARTMDNEIIFGPVTDQFRAYLECMKAWYEKGWLDPAFNERTSDMFYAIDSTNVYQGKIGMWYGLSSQLGGRMDNGDALLEGICAYPAITPMNDIYGPEETRYQTPHSSFAQSLKNVDILISTAAKDKDIPALLTFFDYLYTEEGSRLVSFGLNEEQMAQIQDPIMIANGMSEGAYTIKEDGTLLVSEAIQQNIDLSGVSGGRQLPGVYLEANVDYGYKGVYALAMEMWGAFENVAYFQGDLTSYLTTDEAKQYANITTKVGDYQAVNVPNFIIGKTDPSNDEDWGNWVKMMGKYGYQKINDLIQPYANDHPIIKREAE